MVSSRHVPQGYPQHRLMDCFGQARSMQLLCGLHRMFKIGTGVTGVAEAVLIRSAQPLGRASNRRVGSARRGLTRVHTTGERLYEAELHRLKGTLLPARSPYHQAEAETCFRHALDGAHSQQAKACELRAALSLSRLWQQQGKRAAARELLTEVNGWFTEGFDTANLQEARALLEELGTQAGGATNGPAAWKLP
jgi:hypothetical protein